MILDHNNTQIIALYLPQFHQIPENDKWWGEGYTDWEALKKSTPQYPGHKQPIFPQNNNFYDLSDKNAIYWQIKIAKKYGVNGFGIYHYWFDSNLHILEKPSELIRDDNSLDFSYFLIWDNNSWRRTWTKIQSDNDYSLKDKEILAKLNYGSKIDWKIHFDYLYSHFSNKKYIMVNEKPLFAFFNLRKNEQIIRDMCIYWEKLAIERGLKGITFMSASNFRRSRLEYIYRYEPFCACKPTDWIKSKFMVYKSQRGLGPTFYDYDKVWKKIIYNAKYIRERKCYIGAIVKFDDTPRRGMRARIIKGSTPEKFEIYMRELINISQKQKKKFIFITAWNEWGEGAYLEPDEENGYAYLEALKRAHESI